MNERMNNNNNTDNNNKWTSANTNIVTASNWTPQQADSLAQESLYNLISEKSFGVTRR